MFAILQLLIATAEENESGGLSPAFLFPYPDLSRRNSAPGIRQEVFA